MYKLLFFSILSLTTTNGFQTQRYVPKASLAVFGARGKTGKLVVAKALEMDKPVVSLIRPHYDGQSTSDHTIYLGDVTNLEDVKQVYQNHDISGTIICLGGSTKEVGETMLTDGTRNIIQCIKESNASKRIAVVTSIGAGNSVNEPPFFFKMLMATVLKDAFVDKNNQEALFLDGDGIGNDLDFTIVRPSGLNDKDAEPVAIIHKGSGMIPRASVARFCYSAVYDKKFPSLKQAVCITSLQP